MSQQTVPYCIVGFGIAGQLLLLELLKAGVHASELVVCDETFLGGDLLTQYASVQSNTPWWKTRKALEQYLPWSKDALYDGDALYQANQCMPVGDIAKLCLKAAINAGHSVEKVYATIQSLKHTGEYWSLTHSKGSIQANTVFLCQGGQPTNVDLSIPRIPLSIALNKDTLQRVVSANDRVVVIGTAHSGTIILQNLHELKVPTVALYRTPTPFRFARDGVYDGIKEGSEVIADAILRGEHPTTRLVSFQDALEVHSCLQKATKLISAIGFRPRCLFGPEFSEYDPATALLNAGPNLAGFGLAYPGITVHNEKKYVDVSVLSFQEQIQRCLPALLQIRKQDTK